MGVALGRFTLFGILLLLAAIPQPAASAAPDGPDDTTAVVENPGEWATRPGPPQSDESIAQVAEELYLMGYDKGFAALRTDYSSGAIIVHWNGAAPDDIRAYAASKPKGVSVVLAEGARLSRAEIHASARSLSNSDLVGRFGIVGIDVADDSSGMVVQVSGSSRLTPGDMTELTAVLGQSAIEVEYGVAAATTYATRWSDGNPWKGGGAMSVNGAGCSTGFAVLAGGYGRLLSARHCDPTGNGVVYSGGGTLIAPGGSSVSVVGAIDSMLVDPSASPATTAKVYRSGYSSGTLSTVKSWYSNWPGDPVCASGAYSGEHCGTVYDDNDYVVIDGYTVNVIQVSAPSGMMGGSGDSGGPLFKLVTGGVQARGILLGPDLTYPELGSCPGVLSSRCSRYINYVPISTILNTWGVSLEVG